MRENLFEPWSDGVARVGLLFLVTGLAFIVGAFTLPATVGMGPIVLLALIGAGLALFGVGRLQSLRMERELDEVERVLDGAPSPRRALKLVPERKKSEVHEDDLPELSFVEDRRMGTERRTGRARRAENETEPFVERRNTTERRAGQDRRNPYEDFVLGLA